MGRARSLARALFEEIGRQMFPERFGLGDRSFELLFNAPLSIRRENHGAEVQTLALNGANGADGHLAAAAEGAPRRARSPRPASRRAWFIELLDEREIRLVAGAAFEAEGALADGGQHPRRSP